MYPQTVLSAPIAKPSLLFLSATAALEISFTAVWPCLCRHFALLGRNLLWSCCSRSHVKFPLPCNLLLTIFTEKSKSLDMSKFFICSHMNSSQNGLLWKNSFSGSFLQSLDWKSVASRCARRGLEVSKQWSLEHITLADVVLPATWWQLLTFKLL